ncbi:MAG: HYR domain-containing protein [Saprospiraceae bacterium]
MIITPLPFGIYPLGNIAPNGQKDLILRVRTNNCSKDSLEFVAGWGCENYPTTIEEALCADPSTIYFIPANSGLNMNVLNPSVDLITDLCNEVTYEVEILSTNLGFLRDIYFQSQFAPNETYVSGSLEMAYPSVTNGGTYASVVDPTSIAGGFELDVSPLNTYLNTVGLVGSKDLDSNKVSLRFKTITSCNFASGSRARFLTNAYSACGDPLSAVSKTAARIRVTSEPPSFNVDLALGDLNLNACNNQQGLSVVNMVLNSGSPSVNDSIKYILPPGIQYVSGSYTPISNAVSSAPLIKNVGGIQTLSWPFKPGLGLGSNISFSIKVQAIDIGQLCTDYTIVVQAYSTINDMCGAQTCNVGIIAGEGTQNVSIVKPKLKFQNVTGTLTLLPAPTNQVKATFNATLLNMGAALQAGSTINMDIYDDVDGNGSLSSSDVFVTTVSGTNASVLLPNQTISIMGMNTFPAGSPSICSVIAVLDPQNTCTCDLETSFKISPEIIVNMETMPEVCSSTSIAVGPEATSGYTVEWISIDGSNLSLLSSTTSTPTNFSMVNNTGVNQTVKYAIRTSAGDDCYVYDTISIIVFPAFMDVVSLQACQNQSFSLPAAGISGTNYIWVPSAGLTFPGPDGRYAVISNVSSGTSNYDLTYTDANGCPASYSYEILGIDCGVANTRIGDYVWFDLNKDGIQDSGEAPIEGMTVNLYNANNGSIISSTTTDATGYYLFDYLPQGSYFVEFIPLDGFMVTTPNQGTQGSNSIANTTTGRTPNYFLPLDSETLYVDAGMTAMCNLDMSISVGECVEASSSTLKRIVTVQLDWENNVYTYPFLNGSDTITVVVLGQTVKVPVNSVDGAHTFSFDWQPVSNTMADGTATFKYAPMCSANASGGTFGPCTFDLALRKIIVTPSTPPYKYGDILQYRIEVVNQGTIPAANVNIIDYKPAGLEFVTAQNPDWFLNPQNNSEAFIAGPILPGQTISKEIYYKILMHSGDSNAWTNFAEITHAEDNSGNDRSGFDIDSSPDNDSDNDAGGGPGTSDDDRLDGNGNDDEDDHDGAKFSVFDLALVKTIATPGPYTFGQEVQFDITVFNQGNETANSITIIDYIPAGYSYRPVNSPAWSHSSGFATRTIVNPLLPGTSITVPIILRIENAASNQYINIAEISSATNSSGLVATDFDGVFDNNPSNDPGGIPDTASDNAEEGNGTGVGSPEVGDEDNMDVARVAVPAIELQKSVVNILPASSGNVANNDVTFSLTLQNTGNESLTMLTLSDNFIAQFGGSFIRIVNMPSIFSSTATTNPTLNASFNGGVNDQIFNGISGVLDPTQTIQVRLTLELMDVDPANPLVNEATTSGQDRFDTVVRDTAQAFVTLPTCFLKVNCPVPNQGNYSCAGDVPSAFTSVSTFNSAFGVNAIENYCMTPIITFNDVVIGSGCAASPQTITRTYTITDMGTPPIGTQSETCTVIYSVVDSIKPVFMTPPCNLYLECGAATNTTTINTWLTMNGKSVAADNCDASVTITNSLIETNTICGNSTVRKYKFTATDDCGNEIDSYGFVYFEDRVAPVLTLPTATSSVACNGNISTAVTTWLNSASANDQCGGTVRITSAQINEVNGCSGVNSRTTRTYLFTATDGCGNASTNTATFTITDNTAPTIAAPANLMITCGQDNGAAIVDWLDNYTVTEACQTYTVTNNYTGVIPNLCGGSQTITWTVTDDCGATGTSSAMIIASNDATPPVFSNCPSDIVVNVDVDLCTSNVVYSTPVATDCNGPVTVVRTAGIASGSTFPLGVTTITFTATDRCNNTSTCSFDITVVDSDVPTINCPDNDVAVCANGSCVWRSTAALNPIGVENCPGSNISYVITGETTGMGSGNVPPNTSFALGTSVVTYTIMADNGQTSSCSFNVVVSDCTVPVITCPSNLLLECADANNGTLINNWLTSATALDNCTAVPVETTLLINTVVQCGNTERRLYKFTATDDAGNKDECFAEVIINDTTIPSIQVNSAPLTVDCNGNGNSEQLLDWLNNNGGASAIDLCGGLTWSNDFGSISDLCASTGSSTVIFTVTDDCGNTNTTQATFTIRDIADPVLTCPADITLECSSPFNNAIITSWLNSATAEDVCSGTLPVTNNYSSVFSAGCGLSGINTVTFSVVDQCGNDVMCTRTITINDTTLPTITNAPSPQVVECDGSGNLSQLNTWLSNQGGATAIDQCSTPAQLTWSTPVLVNTQIICGGSIVYTYRFEVVDACNNASLPVFATFTIQDKLSPMISTPASDLTVDCDGSGNISQLDTWLNAHGNAVASDLCSTPLIWQYDLVKSQGQCGKTGIFTYRFTVSDACGNIGTSEADFIIRDITDPDITTDATDFNAQCNGASNSVDILNWLNNNGFAQATDECNGIDWTNDYGTIIADCGTTGVVTVTFTATDACGNSSTTAAEFSITDTTPPAWEILPQDLNMTCDGLSDPDAQITAWLNIAGGGEAEDSCSLIKYTNDFTVLSGGCSEGTGSALVTFTATDACGNFVTATATVNVEDVNPPYFSIQARDTIVECDGSGNISDLNSWLNNHGGARASDNCSEPLTWNYSLINTVQGCGRTSTARYAFTATDACDNTSVTTEALFIIKDTSAPTFDEVLQDSIVQCDGTGNLTQLNGWLAAHAGLIAEDVCNSTATVSFDLVKETKLCGLTGTSLYRFTITDACGNNATDEASFIIVDTLPPMIVGGADMEMEECNNPLSGNYPEFDFWLTNHAGASATDICGGYSWSNNYNPNNWETRCGNTRSVDVTFYVTDICDNVDSITHTFSIGDVTPPTFTNCPSPPVIVDAPAGWCSAFANFAAISATDNCSTVTITQIDKTGYTSGSLFPVGTTILMYEADDACGNKDTCTLKIIVNDFHTPPTIECPVDLTVNNDLNMCGAIVRNIAPNGITDNCINNLSVTYDIRDKDNNIVTCGFNDASGFKFSVGKNIVNYTIKDQPLLLITEIINDGIVSGIEITNFGPAKYNIACLSMERIGTSPEVFIVPDAILDAGSVYTHNFTPVPVGSPAAYQIRYYDNFIDGVAINGFSPSEFSWTGSLMSNAVFRTRICDTNSNLDFSAADDCNLPTYGFINPSLPILPDNGAVTSLQSRPPSIDVCSFMVTVVDNENPYCAEFDTVQYVPVTLPLAIGQGSCTSASLTVPVSAVDQVADVNILNLEGTYPDMGGLTFKLISPQGTEITLFDRLCSGTDNFDINLDDEASSTISSVTCAPAGQNSTFKPLKPFKTFFGEKASGTWTLEVFTALPLNGQLTSFELEIIKLFPYSQRDTMLNNDPGICGAAFTWQHPRIGDNCCIGTIRVDYTTDDDIKVPASGPIPGMGGQITSQNFEVGTTTVTYTLTDQYGNVSQCSFDVTIMDNEKPIIAPNSCTDITVQLQGTQCETNVTYPILTAMDNCSIDSVQYNPPVGHLFPIGTTEVQVVVFDPSGNSDTCTFDVIVLPYIPTSNSMACKQEINLSLDATCTAYITAGMVLSGTNFGCYDDYCITLMYPDGTILGTNMDSTHKVDITHVGKKITVKICEDCSSTANCCWTTVNVEEKLIPQIDCPEDITIQCNETDDPKFTGLPVLKSCEPNIEITFVDEYTDNEYCGDPRAVIQRVWTVRDDENNVVTCNQSVTVERFDMAQIQFPADFVLDDAFDCDDVTKNPMLIDTSATGQPTIDGKNIYGDHLCEFNLGYYDEKLIDVNCKNSFEILRHWTIRDECSPILLNINPMRYIQAIKVNDRKAPIFSKCFDDVTISTVDRNCTGEYTLPSLSGLVQDGCGDIKSIQITVDGGTVIGVGSGVFKSYKFTNMAVGTHNVKIKAIDYCRNFAVCEFKIQVIDKTAPTVICNDLTVISLTSDGSARLKADVLDDGSYDNCGEVLLEIYRMLPSCEIDQDTIPGPDIELCCEDIANSPVQIVLRAWDDANKDGIYGNEGDNYSECMSNIKVEYKLLPDFVCPNDITINCTQDQTDLNITGKPELYTACGAPKVLYVDLDVSLNSCGIGGLVRRWSVENKPGVGCDQMITIESIRPVTEDSIIWPADTIVNCLNVLASQNPVIKGGACDMVAYQMEADTFTTVPDACYKILKEWTVIDWCQYQLNDPSSAGKWTHQQIIKVVDTIAPIISNCNSNDIIFVNSSSCNIDAITISAEANDQSCGTNQPLLWNYGVDINNDGLVEFTGALSGNSVSKLIQYQGIKSAKVYWTVTDGCNNQSSCVQNYKINDNKPPQAYCKNLAVSLSQDGSVEVWANDFDNGSSDACTPKEKLLISFSESSIIPSKTFTCADILNGVSQDKNVVIWFVDESGNKAYCTSVLSLQDNNDACPNSTQIANLGGKISTELGESIDSVNVDLKIGVLEIESKNTLSDEQGEYLFKDLYEQDVYEIFPSKDINWMNGISTLDLVLIQRHILDIESLKSPYLLIAADANNDGKVTVADLSLLRKLILGVISNIKENQSWRFVEKSFVFKDVALPWPFPSKIFIDSVDLLTLNEDFVGIKIGDVNYSADPSARSIKTEARNAQDFIINYRIEPIPDNDNRMKVDFFAGESVQLHGIQMSLDLVGDTPKVIDGQLNISHDEIYFVDGQWRVALSNATFIDKSRPIFSLEIDVNNQLSLGAMHFNSEIYTGDDMVTRSLKLLRFGQNVGANQFAVRQNVPNPFRDATSIQFELPTKDDVVFEVHNNKGDLIHSSKQTYSAGRNTIDFVRQSHMPSGVYYYTVTSSEASTTFKMIILE